MGQNDGWMIPAFFRKSIMTIMLIMTNHSSIIEAPFMIMITCRHHPQTAGHHSHHRQWSWHWCLALYCYYANKSSSHLIKSTFCCGNKLAKKISKVFCTLMRWQDSKVVWLSKNRLFVNEKNHAVIFLLPCVHHLKTNYS